MPCLKSVICSSTSTAPAAGTPMNRVIKWVEAGTPVEPSGFHTATRDGQSTSLGDDVAFVVPSGTARCATDKNVEGQLACLIKADDLPSKPADVAPPDPIYCDDDTPCGSGLVCLILPLRYPAQLLQGG